MSKNDQEQREAVIQLLEGRAEVGGRFTNLRCLDNGTPGTFSLLFSASDSAMHCDVALKFLLPNWTGSYRDDSFEREAVLLEELRGQPDIIQLIAPQSQFTEILTAGNGMQFSVSFSYYVLERAKTDIGAIIADEEWSAEELLVAFRAMCRSVQRLHSKSIAHRDLTPPNFLVMADRTIRMSDLGTARRLDGVTPPLATYTGPPGDLRYSAPEMLAIVHDEMPSIAFQADFFSLGAILFELFSGTILGSRIYDRLITELPQVMSLVKTGRRRQVFDQLIGTIADARIIPSVSTFGASVPGCILRPIDDLVRRLASLDYRKRLCEFPRIFNRVNACLLVLRNEQKYKLWLAEKRRRRDAARLVTIRSHV